MAQGLTFSDGKPAKVMRGRYQTRNSRVVEITGHHFVDQANGGVVYKRKIWDGVLLNALANAPETKGEWDDEGHDCGGGVGSGFDLGIVMTQEPDEPIDDGVPAVLENQLAFAALMDILTPEAVKADKEGENPVFTLKRIISERDAAQQQVAELLKKPVA